MCILKAITWVCLIAGALVWGYMMANIILIAVSWLTNG